MKAIFRQRLEQQPLELCWPVWYVIDGLKFLVAFSKKGLDLMLVLY